MSRYPMARPLGVTTRRRPIDRLVVGAFAVALTIAPALGCAAAEPGPEDAPPGSGAVGEARSVERGVVPDGCAEVSAAVVRVTAAGSSFGTSTPGTIDTGGLDRDIDAARAVVPEQIRADFEVWAATYREFAETLADIDRTGGAANPANAERYTAVAALFDRPEFVTASANLDAYFTDNCSGSSDTTGP